MSEVPVGPLTWIAVAHGLHRRSLALLVMSWIVAAGLTRVGIPDVDPRLDLIPRPLETLGTAALCLPASLHASLLRNQASWLSSVSPRSAPWLRVWWLMVILVVGSIGATAWLLTLQAGVPRGHAVALWILLQACAVLSVVLLRHDLAVVIPLLVVIVFTLGRALPFELNIVYNVERTASLAVTAAIVLLAAVGLYARFGDRRDRIES